MFDSDVSNSKSEDMFTDDGSMTSRPKNLIKNMLKRRKKSDTYLATFHRHHWSAQMTMRKDNLLELSASTATFIS